MHSWMRGPSWGTDFGGVGGWTFLISWTFFGDFWGVFCSPMFLLLLLLLFYFFFKKCFFNVFLMDFIGFHGGFLKFFFFSKGRVLESVNCVFFPMFCWFSNVVRGSSLRGFEVVFRCFEGLSKFLS